MSSFLLYYIIFFFFFFFNDTATTEIYTLSLHDALPISSAPSAQARCQAQLMKGLRIVDRVSKSSHTLGPTSNASTSETRATVDRLAVTIDMRGFPIVLH